MAITTPLVACFAWHYHRPIISSDDRGELIIAKVRSPEQAIFLRLGFWRSTFAFLEKFNQYKVANWHIVDFNRLDFAAERVS